MRQALENPTALGNFLTATTDLQPVHNVSKRAKLGRKGNISFLEERIPKKGPCDVSSLTKTLKAFQSFTTQNNKSDSSDLELSEASFQSSVESSDSE